MPRLSRDSCGDAFALPHQAHEEMLRADVVMAEPSGLVYCQLDDLLRPGSEADLTRTAPFASADDELDG